MFLFKATAFYWIVWLVTKAVTTYGSFYRPDAINAWYDWNQQMIRAVPTYGSQLRALVRDNVADGTIAFWEIWIVVGILVSLFKLANRQSR